MFVDKTDLKLVEGFFDPEFYSKQLDEKTNGQKNLAEHFCQIGWMKGLDPIETFSTKFYLANNPDIYAGQINPYIHYLKFGKAEGRLAKFIESKDDKKTNKLIAPHFDAEFYRQKYKNKITFKNDLLKDYIILGSRLGRWPNPEFCPAFYTFNNPDILSNNISPFVHYVHHGKSEGRTPNIASPAPLLANKRTIVSHFDPIFYMSQIPVEYHPLHIDWLDHYIIYGYKDGLNPNPLFDTKKYLTFHSDLNNGHIEPLNHYIEHGFDEGRNIFAVEI